MRSVEDSGVSRSARFAEPESDGDTGGRRMTNGLKLAISIIVILVAAIILLVADGVRRENRELTALLDTFTGDVQVFKGGESPSVVPEGKMTLRNKDVITTGDDSSATVVFPDGSAIQLEPKTRFTVVLLDFARGGRRNRSFMVDYGSVVARVSHFFGAESRATIYTPTAVAAARGTGLRIGHQLPKQKSLLEVGDGTVEFQCGESTVFCEEGQTVESTGTRMGAVHPMSPDALQHLKEVLDSLAAYESAPRPLQKLEWRITRRLGPLLQLFGIGPSGKAVEVMPPPYKAEAADGAGETAAEDLAQPFTKQPSEELVTEQTGLQGGRRKPFGWALTTHETRGKDKFVPDWAKSLVVEEIEPLPLPEKMAPIEELPPPLTTAVASTQPEETPTPESSETPPPPASSETPPAPETQVLAQAPIELGPVLGPVVGSIGRGAGAKWLIPGLLGAGTAVALAAPHSSGTPAPEPVPEPSGLLVISASLGLSSAVIRMTRIRRRRDQ